MLIKAEFVAKYIIIQKASILGNYDGKRRRKK